MHPRLMAFVTLVALGAGEHVAHAQACCTTTSTIFPARLQDDEDALVGVALKGAGVFGSYDSQRTLHGQPTGAGEADFGQTLLVTARMFGPLQLNVAVPFVETWRSVSGTTDFGGGPSDLSLSLRWDLLRAPNDPVVPGIAPTLSLIVPSGTPAEVAHNPLGADATGLGAAELAVGLAVEKNFGRMLFALTGSALFHGARTVRGVHSQLGPELAATLGASYTFPSGFALGGSLSYIGSFDSTVDGVDSPNSARALTQLALVGALPIRGNMRVLGSVFFVPPISGVAQNEPGTVGLSLTLIYGFKSAVGCVGGTCSTPVRH